MRQTLDGMNVHIFQEFRENNVQLVERYFTAREIYKLTERTLIRSNAIYATRRSVIDQNSDVIKEPCIELRKKNVTLVERCFIAREIYKLTE